MRLIALLLLPSLAALGCSAPDEGNSGAQQPTETSRAAPDLPANSAPDASGRSDDEQASGNGAGPGNGAEARDAYRTAGPVTGSNAASYQHLVGRNRSEIPPRPEGAVWRITCTNCPMTMEYNESRLNILYDEESGTIEVVKCG